MELDLPFIFEGEARELHNKLMREILLESMKPAPENSSTFTQGTSISTFNYIIEQTEATIEFNDDLDVNHNHHENCITLHSAPSATLPILGISIPPLELEPEVVGPEPVTMEVDEVRVEVEAEPMETVQSEDESDPPPPRRDLFSVSVIRVNNGETYGEDSDEEERVLPFPKYDVSN